jgi:hypothetical protein
VPIALRQKAIASEGARVAAMIGPEVPTPSTPSASVGMSALAGAVHGGLGYRRRELWRGRAGQGYLRA